MLRFFAFTYLLTWTFWAVAAVLSDSSLRTTLLLLGTFSPAFIALGLTLWGEGKPGLATLWTRIFIAPDSARWYVFAIGYIVSVKLAAAVLHRLIIGSWPAFGSESLVLIAVAILISTPVQAGEELGWRGYALPRLTARFGLARASLVLGAIWAFWHLPLFYIPGIPNYGQSFPVFFLGGVTLSVAMAWLYGHTGGSLSLAMLMHSAVNQTNGIVPTRFAVPGNPLDVDTSPITLLTIAVGLASAGYFLACMPRASHSRYPVE